jgi:hypothetical protein
VDVVCRHARHYSRNGRREAPIERPDRISFAHPANAAVLGHLAGPGSAAGKPPSASPEDVTDPYYTLGTHPDLVGRLWDELGGVLPEDCRWVVSGRPVLAHPRTGVIFGFAGGTHTYALRLPEAERRHALASGARRSFSYRDGTRVDLDVLGEDWVLGGWLTLEPDWCLAAYGAAGAMAPR